MQSPLLRLSSNPGGIEQAAGLHLREGRATFDATEGSGRCYGQATSRKGCSPDNAACEGFFGRLKTELFYPRDWRATTVDQFIEILDSYIRWYNATRIKVSLGSLSPLEYWESLGIAA